MKKVSIKQYLFYLMRWQLSTPILAVVLVWLSTFGETIATIVANLIGGLIFFWVDKLIFRARGKKRPEWEIRETVRCADCGREARGYRLVKAPGYDRSGAKAKYRCEECSARKTHQLREQGVAV
jgi:hypothetical protein